MKKIFFIGLVIIAGLLIILQACKDEELPEVTSGSKIELTITEDTTSYVFAQLTCAINEMPKFTVEQYGFCWDTIASVNIEKQNNSFGSLTSQAFQKNIESLLPNKNYYIKAYIQNGDVIIYSNELTIQTKDARPIVTTNDITTITGISAESGGSVIAYETLFPITQRGICWVAEGIPDVSDSISVAGSENEEFQSSMQNLMPGVTYHVRAYAINSEGVGYGEEKSFSTLDGVPQLTTDSINNITATSATFYGNILDNDGMEILEKGFCLNTTSNPTVENNTLVVAGNELGSFSQEITSLEINTTYYVKAYVKNEAGTFYDNEISFSTEDGLPSLTTTEITNITATTSISGGSIAVDGGFAVTARGVCWSTASNPTISDNYTTDGSGTGSFSSNLTGLDVNTIYFVRAYATNNKGTAYGNEISFTTEDGLPTLITTEITNITATTATSGGNIADDGGFVVTNYGICWSNNPNPTFTDDHTSDGSGTGSFSSSLTVLDVNTTYYVRAYSTNSIGTAYGNEINFTTKDGIPTLNTSAITNITATTATSGGNITDDGGLTVTSRGVCWSTSQNPTITDSKTTDGSGLGAFNSNLTGLNANITYYVRAYATNSIGTVYGTEKLFTTNDGELIITTTEIENITATTATCGGNITDDGGATITARGVCWSTSQNPTIANNKTADGSGTGNYNSSLTGLNVNTTYYVRAYATNSIGTVYGTTKSFTTDDGSLVISTTEITDITTTTATSGGNITDDGGTTVISRGICWSTSQNPTIANSKTINGSGIGVFSSSLTGLDVNTSYYVRAYATNNLGTVYGNAKNFATYGLPVVTTNNVSSITATSVTCGGNISNDGGAAIISRGICWSTSQNPTVNNNTTNDGTGTGSFSSSLSGLNSNTTYFIRAYATSSVGTDYGEQQVFKTAPGEIGDSYRGGIIAYILQPGDSGYEDGQAHGLIATPNDISANAEWGCYGTTINGTSTSISSGQANTIAIVGGCSEEGIAAKICNDLVLNGYDDWYLPSLNELLKLYDNKVAIGGFVDDYYWSSSEYASGTAWDVRFSDGYHPAQTKIQNYRVRAIRAF